MNSQNHRRSSWFLLEIARMLVNYAIWGSFGFMFEANCPEKPAACVSMFWPVRNMVPCSYGPLPLISTNKTPFIECIIPLITSYN